MPWRTGSTAGSPHDLRVVGELVVTRRSGGRPVIGLCARTAPVTLQGIDVTVSLALQSHVDFLAAAGCTPVLLPLLPGVGHVAGQLDGLLVPGGPDVAPALYAQTTHPRTRGVDEAMDAAELELLEAALNAGLPVLAICRGMQLLNVHLGGTLHQHLPQTLGHDGHCPETGEYTLGNQCLHLEPGSRIAEIIGGEDAPVAACHHHQAIDKLGTGLRATAWAPDGVIEVVEAVDHPFVLGVQWEAGQTEDRRLHLALAEAAGRVAARPVVASALAATGRTRRNGSDSREEDPMSPRMANPSLVVPDALPPLLELTKVVGKVGVPPKTLDLIRLRVSQINGRSIQIPESSGDLGEAGETDERLSLVATWQDASGFDDAERAALALAEAATRLSDRENPVPDEVWEEAARHYDERELGALVIQIGLVNLWNRVNVATGQVPGDWN